MILNGENFLINYETILRLGRGDDQINGRGKKKTTVYTIEIMYQDKWDVKNNKVSTINITFEDLKEREKRLATLINQVQEQVKENNNENNY